MSAENFMLLCILFIWSMACVVVLRCFCVLRNMHGAKSIREFFYGVSYAALMVSAVGGALQVSGVRFPIDWITWGFVASSFGLIVFDRRSRRDAEPRPAQ